LIMKHWLEETYKLKGITPRIKRLFRIFSWRRLTN